MMPLGSPHEKTSGRLFHIFTSLLLCLYEDSFHTLTGVNQTLEALNSKAFYIAVPAGTISKIYVTTTALQYSGVKSIEITRSNITSKKSATLSAAGFSAVTYSEASSLIPTIICGTIWAPVNCGYSTSGNYGTCGLLYQWGKKQGFATSGSIETSTTILDNMAAGTNCTTFIVGPDDSNNYCWYKNPSQNDTWPSDASYNPCPSGWRVPTYAELNALTGNSGTTSIGTGGWDGTNKGYWLNGTTSPVSGQGLFLPAAGCRMKNGYVMYNSLGKNCYYWTSSKSTTKSDNYTNLLNYYSNALTMDTIYRAYGCSVRCVQE